MIFIIMEITRIGYQKALNAFLPRKYTFVERVEITRGPGIKMGMFICNLNIITKEGFYFKIKGECKDRFNIGDTIGFWPFIQCYGKNYDIIGLDYSHQNGPLSLSVGAIIESVVNSTGNVSKQVLIKPESQTISFTFNKAISNQPTLGINGGASYQFSSKSNSDKTLHYNFTNISSNSNLIIVGSIVLFIYKI